MSSILFFFIFVPILAAILLAINWIFSPHNPYLQKDSVFECGFTSFLGQNRTQFSVSFFIFALIFLLFDLEILLVYPYIVSGYTNSIYGLAILLIFFFVLTLGFAFELGKKALNIESRQVIVTTNKEKTATIFSKINNLHCIYPNKGDNNNFILNKFNNVTSINILNKIVNINKIKKIFCKFIVISSISIITREFTNYIFNINVFIEYTHYISLIYYLLFYCTILFINDLSSNVKKPLSYKDYI